MWSHYITKNIILADWQHFWYDVCHIFPWQELVIIKRKNTFHKGYLRWEEAANNGKPSVNTCRYLATENKYHSSLQKYTLIISVTYIFPPGSNYHSLLRMNQQRNLYMVTLHARNISQVLTKLQPAVPKDQRTYWTVVLDILYQ